MTETLQFTAPNLDLQMILNEIKTIVGETHLEIMEESAGTDKDGNNFLSLHAQLPKSKSTLEKVKKAARAILGGQRDLIVVLRGDVQDFVVEIAMGKMVENVLASGLAGLVLLGPLGLALSPASFVVAVKYEKDLATKIKTAIDTLVRAQEHFASETTAD